jgi:long-chain acyl-CoA synthetase
VHELHVASSVTTVTQSNTADFVFDSARTRPDHVAVRRKIDGDWVDVTSQAFADEVAAVAKGLIAAGIGPGDRVAVMSRTRYEWSLVDFALFCAGAVVVPVYETSSAEQLEWILADSGTRAVFAETDAHAKLIESVREHCPQLGPIWCFDADGLEQLRAAGGEVPDQDVAKRRAEVTLDDLASIIYTSGTTGRPKGCRLTHRCFVSEVLELGDGLHQLLNERASTLLFLPIAHVFGRAVHIGALATGCTLGHTADVADLIEDLDGFRPTFVLAVPRVFEKVYNTAKQRAHAQGKGKVFGWAEQVAIAYSHALDRGRPPLWLTAAHRLFDRLVYGKMRAALGGRCVAAVSGGAPLGERLGHFFRGIGVTIYEGYGLTETTAGVAVNRPGALRIGTVGRPVGGATARIAPDGEVLFKAPIVFDGYWNDDAATAEAIDGEGWFHTGDLGELDEDGYLRITGRKKELIVTAAGKNVAPAVLEDRIRAHWLVSQCLVVGDRRPFVAALITLDAEAVPDWLGRQHRPATTPVGDLVDDAALRAEIQQAVDDANRAVSRAESIRKFAILPHDWSESGGQITPSLKLRRAVVLEQSAQQIAELYAG